MREDERRHRDAEGTIHAGRTRVADAGRHARQSADRRPLRPSSARGRPARGACRNVFPFSAVRVNMISSSTAISRAWSASRASLFFFAMSGRPSTSRAASAGAHCSPPDITSAVLGGTRRWSHGMAVAARLGMPPFRRIAGEVRTHQDHRDIEHRHVDALALAGLLALEQRGRECESAGHAGRIVDGRRTELDRVHILVPVIAMMPEVA